MATESSGGASAARQAIEIAADTAGQLDTSYGRRTIVTNMVTKVEVHDQKVDIQIDRAALLRRLGLVATTEVCSLHLTAPAAKVRRGSETRLVLNAEHCSGGGRAPLLDLLREAVAVRERVLTQPEKTLAELARESGQCRKRMSRLLRLSWLAPAVVEHLLRSTSAGVMDRASVLGTRVPLAWSEQMRWIGHC